MKENRKPFSEEEIAEVVALLAFMEAENLDSDDTEHISEKLPSEVVDKMGILAGCVQYKTMSTHPNISRPLAAAMVINSAKNYNFTDPDESMKYLIDNIFNDSFDLDEICEKCDVTMEDLNNLMTIGFTEGLKFFPIEINVNE